MSTEFYGDPALKKMVGFLTLIDDVTEGRDQRQLVLQIGGSLVSGTVISEAEYMRSHPLLDQLSEVNAKVANEEGLGKGSDTAPDFIHLKNARVYAPGQLPIPASGMYWRGRYENVAGFGIGSLSHEVLKVGG